MFMEIHKHSMEPSADLISATTGAEQRTAIWQMFMSAKLHEPSADTANVGNKRRTERKSDLSDVRQVQTLHEPSADTANVVA
jgi:hypothetical protein